MVCPYSLSRPGGVQGQVVGLVRALDARGHQATVFAPLDDRRDAPSDVNLVVTGQSALAVAAKGEAAGLPRPG
jgi:phosphatidylinositol alpha-mannosyltransferase